MSRSFRLLLLLFTLLPLTMLAHALTEVSGYTVSWIGNTWGGAPSDNDFGRWVPNWVNDFDVYPDGTCFTASDWDEGGRACSLFNNTGEINYVSLKLPDGLHGDANSWGVIGNACAITADYLYVAALNNNLLRFAWKTGDVQSGKYDAVFPLGAGAGEGDAVTGMSARAGKLATVRPGGSVVVYTLAGTPTEVGNFKVDSTDCRDIALDARDHLWVIAGNAIRKYRVDGTEIPGHAITKVERPVAISLDPRGRLMVCDEGASRQIYIFDISATPRLVKTFGIAGGITAGTPGQMGPRKFYSLKGCGADMRGNIYVAMGTGHTVVQKYTPSGTLAWSRYGLQFVDVMSFMPGTDGTVLYGPDQMYTMDYAKPRGQEWRYAAYTVDTVKDANTRMNGVGYCRRVQGKRVLYTIAMYAGGYGIAVFDDETSQIARSCPPVTDGGGWAWGVDTNGTIWHGDAKGEIHEIPLTGFDAKGDPIWGAPVVYPWPAEWTEIDRIIYQPETDTMYLSGFDREHPTKEWGNAGAVIRRYDRWKQGNRTATWATVMPEDDGRLPQNCIDVAGDYFFTVTCKDIGNIYAVVGIYRVSDGKFVGHMASKGDALVGPSGWVDIPYGLHAVQRSNGEYVVIVEEDWRAKNVLYRWTPQP